MSALDFRLGDCFDHMADIPDGSVDMVLADLPYGTTDCAWDSALPLDRLWSEYFRVCAPSAVIVLTATQPFASAVVMSNIQNFKYQWVWEKTAAVGFLNAKKQPLRAHELVLVFGGKIYNPQKRAGYTIKRSNPNIAKHGDIYGKAGSVKMPYCSTERYPRDVLLFPKDNRMGSPHPTQKPVALFEYLIRTYTNPGELVLDNTAGSGTTAIAAENAGRRWICIERDPTYWALAVARVMDHRASRLTNGGGTL